MKRYDVMKKWSEGFSAGIAVVWPYEQLDCEHWQAGYLAGYKARPIKNAALDEYLISTGREPQAKITLCREAAGEGE